jgi:hypothetical protein
MVGRRHEVRQVDEHRGYSSNAAADGRLALIVKDGKRTAERRGSSRRLASGRGAGKILPMAGQSGYDTRRVRTLAARRLRSASLPWALALVAMALEWPALWGGWQLDDRFQRQAMFGKIPGVRSWIFWKSGPGSGLGEQCEQTNMFRAAGTPGSAWQLDGQCTNGIYWYAIHIV